MSRRSDVSEGRNGWRLNRREFLALAGGTAAGILLPHRLLGQAVAPAATGPAAASAPARPNIIVILADDLGYADLGVHGCKDIPTPHIDSLAAGGVRFSSGYVSCPVCSPTRAGLLTGRYQQRFGHEFNPGALPPADFGLPVDQVTLADVLKSAGYATALVGKWHLGGRAPFHPRKRGFDEFFGFLHGSHPYTDLKPVGVNPIYRGIEPVEETEYLTDAFTREAVAFIQRRKDRPFFLLLAYNAVHTPMQAAEKYLKRFADIADPRRRTYAGMLTAMDDGVGGVLDKLRRERLLDGTLVFFLSDNGGPVQAGASVNGSRNAPLRGSKGQVYEGGVRVPFLMHWPGGLGQGAQTRPAKGKLFDQPVISLDVFSTAVAAAEASPPADRILDGVDLLACLTGRKEGPPHEALYWRFGQQRAIRRGRWKLLRRAAQPAELYDLSADIAESKDLAAANRPVVEELSDLLARWNSQLARPRWGPQPPGTRPARQAGTTSQ